MNRLKMLREERGLTQADLAEVIGVKTPQCIGTYELGKRDIATPYLIAFAKFFGVSTDYILGVDNNDVSKDKNLNNLLTIPVLGKIPAGKPVLAQENIKKYISISADMFSVKKASDLFFLKVSGESMNRVVANGSYVLVKKQETAENGDIVVAIANDDSEATLKRFKVIDKQFIMLEPDSSYDKFEPLVISLKANKLRILGKVIDRKSVV